MSYTAYATVEEYTQLLPDAVEVTASDLRQASRHIDSLTYNRIVAAGFENLTEFQQEIIKEVCCRQAQFEVENEDAISSVLSSYSINGVSMNFGSSWNVFTEHGVAMRRDVYSLLQQTGLCCRLLR
jgi:TRAP-type mannitol/chloroaromatic compound transport system substrate-binding protein